MRFALPCALLLVVTACSSPRDDSSSTAAALDGDSLATDLGTVAFDFGGTTIDLVAWSRVTSLKFSAVVTPAGGTHTTFACQLASGTAGAAFHCGDWRGTSFVLARTASGATIAKGPQAPAAGLNLTGDAPLPLDVVAAHGLDAFSVADRVVDAVSQVGAFATPGEDGTVTIDSWMLFDERLDVDPSVHAADGSSAWSGCYDSSQTPDVWATPGSPHSGLAASSVLADRVRALAAWKLANCDRHR